jgi:hypothetical protein
MSVSRQRTTQIRWIGNEQSEAALLAVLDRPMQPAEGGLCERWMRIPERKLGEAIVAIELAGGEVIES